MNAFVKSIWLVRVGYFGSHCHATMQREDVANPCDRRYILAMAKHSTSKRSSSDGKFVAIKGVSGQRNVTTRLGNVTVSGRRPSADVVSSNVAASTAALERVGTKLTKPGVRLPQKKGVPRYSADENNPGVFIRRLDGKVTTGKLQNGQFVETK
ncbi:MAG: hypothetical protein JHD35_00565 [Sphingopyxis sp.]|nr:hypothetical protein [Sphingopyxis sp.]